jgi:hypothetical protein
MHESKLTKVLRKLSAEQRKFCARMLPAHCAGRAESALILFTYLTPYGPEFRQQALAKAAVCAALTWSEKQLIYAQSQLLGAVESCLLMHRALENPVEQQLKLKRIWLELDLPVHYRSSHRKWERALSQYPFHDGNYLQYIYRSAALDEVASASYARTHRPELQRAADTLDASYLWQKMIYFLAMSNARQVLELPYQLHGLTEFRAYVYALPLRQEAWVKLLLAVLSMIETPADDTHYEHVVPLLEQQQQLIPVAVQETIYMALLNYCTQRITRFKDSVYYGRYLALNRKLIEQELLLLEDGYLPPWRLNNIITAALRSGHTEWARQFLEEFRSKLPPDYQENIYRFNLAHCWYYERQYDEAQRQLQLVDISDLLLAVATKNLLVKIYYETEQVDLLLHFLEGYRLYLYRQQGLKPILQQQLKAFITYARRLAKLPAYAPERKAKLYTALKEQPQIIEREWLLAQLE